MAEGHSQSAKNWYATWFDAPYYHILYASRDEKEADFFIKNIIKKLKPKPKSHILDLACGSGRHAFYLASYGYFVTGADLSPNNILQAKQYQCPNLDFMVHNMKQKLPESSYDYIFNFFTSFGYFDTDQEHMETLLSVYQGLKKGGFFLLDFFNTHYIKSNMVSHEILTLHQIQFELERKITDEFVIKNIHVTDGEKQFFFQEKVRNFNEGQLLKMVNDAGFSVEALFGGYDLHSFCTNTSPRLIILAKK